ncbi:MAG: hypothetical protein GYA57_13835 [Myxococcales bacterium]|nr:hypothetical protein [Myxococcales bacterium]
MALALVAVGTFFLPWHVAIDVNPFGALCFAPDCHPDVTISAPKECSGLDHAGAIGVVAVLATLAAQAATFLPRPARGRRIGAIAVMVIAGAALGWDFLAGPVAHLFGRVETYATTWIHLGSLAGVSVTALLQIVAERRGPSSSPPPSPQSPAPRREDHSPAD